MEELNQESKLRISSPLGHLIPHYFGAATDEKGTVSCIITLPLPQPQRDLQHPGVTCQDTYFPHRGAAGAARVVLAAWHLAGICGFQNHHGATAGVTYPSDLRKSCLITLRFD